MMNMDEVPPGLVELLREFTLCVLRNRPSDLHQFAADYFTRAAATSTARPAAAGGSGGPKNNGTASSAIPMYVIVNDDDEEEAQPPPQRKSSAGAATAAGGGRYRRRQSVCGESYNPETDEVTDNHVVYPKSDVERHNLVKAIGGILLFRCLDGDQMNAVVDAMFERKVKAGEHVIEQGDDGDNFYVVQSGKFDVMMTRDGETKRVFQFDNSGCFGELALLYNMPRSVEIYLLFIIY